MLTHRLSWFLFKGEIPKGIDVCHKCDVRDCINPDHLFLGTAQDNIKDMFSKNRKSHKGQNHPGRKMTKEIIDKIFKLRDEGLTQLNIGHLCGICQPIVSKVLRKKHFLQQI